MLSRAPPSISGWTFFSHQTHRLCAISPLQLGGTSPPVTPSSSEPWPACLHDILTHLLTTRYSVQIALPPIANQTSLVYLFCLDCSHNSTQSTLWISLVHTVCLTQTGKYYSYVVQLNCSLIQSRSDTSIPPSRSNMFNYWKTPNPNPNNNLTQETVEEDDGPSDEETTGPVNVTLEDHAPSVSNSTSTPRPTLRQHALPSVPPKRSEVLCATFSP